MNLIGHKIEVEIRKRRVRGFLVEAQVMSDGSMVLWVLRPDYPAHAPCAVLLIGEPHPPGKIYIARIGPDDVAPVVLPIAAELYDDPDEGGQ